MRKLLNWLDKYDDNLWAVFKIVITVALIYLGATLNRSYQKTIVREVIQEQTKK